MLSNQEQFFQPDLALLDRVNQKRVLRQSNEVCDLVAERLFERLSLLKAEPHRVVDLGAGTGSRLQHLQKIFPEAIVVAADLSVSLLCEAGTVPFWRRKPPLVCLDANQLPFVDECIDLVVSNLMLPWIHPPDQFATELQRILSPTGVFFISTAGPDTLMELRSAWSKVDSNAHVNLLLDMHDIGDLLLRSGIADPVIDAERLQINYSSVDSLLDELVSCGALNVLNGRRRGLYGSDIRQHLSRHYPKNDDGSVTATLELIYAHGWKGERKSTPHKAQSEVYISVDSLRGQKN